jgi:hypothetical protein
MHPDAEGVRRYPVGVESVRDSESSQLLCEEWWLKCPVEAGDIEK